MSDACAPRLAAASPACLTQLAPALAALPLFTPYMLDAAALEARWQAALGDPTQTLLVLRGGSSQPLGLCWYAARGAFGGGAYLRLLALVAAAQGQGHGARMLAAFEAATAPPGGWFLLRAAFNGAAGRFYAAHGYREVGTLPGFVRPEVTEIVMWKPRPPPP